MANVGSFDGVRYPAVPMNLLVIADDEFVGRRVAEAKGIRICDHSPAVAVLS